MDGQDRPLLLLPNGVQQHFAPLAVVGEGLRDLRRVFAPIAKPI